MFSFLNTSMLWNSLRCILTEKGEWKCAQRYRFTSSHGKFRTLVRIQSLVKISDSGTMSRSRLDCCVIRTFKAAVAKQHQLISSMAFLNHSHFWIQILFNLLNKVSFHNSAQQQLSKPCSLTVAVRWERNTKNQVIY